MKENAVAKLDINDEINLAALNVALEKCEKEAEERANVASSQVFELEKKNN